MGTLKWTVIIWSCKMASYSTAIIWPHRPIIWPDDSHIMAGHTICRFLTMFNSWSCTLRVEGLFWRSPNVRHWVKVLFFSMHCGSYNRVCIIVYMGKKYIPILCHKSSFSKARDRLVKTKVLIQLSVIFLFCFVNSISQPSFSIHFNLWPSFLF